MSAAVIEKAVYTVYFTAKNLPVHFSRSINYFFAIKFRDKSHNLGEECPNVPLVYEVNMTGGWVIVLHRLGPRNRVVLYRAGHLRYFFVRPKMHGTVRQFTGSSGQFTGSSGQFTGSSGQFTGSLDNK